MKESKETNNVAEGRLLLEKYKRSDLRAKNMPRKLIFHTINSCTGKQR